MKKKILLLYPFYWPHYKAGGPIQSIFNFVDRFRDEAQYFIVSSTSDIDGVTNETLVPGHWTKGPSGENIFYTTRITPKVIQRVFKSIQPDRVILNGLFNLNTTLAGIFAAKCYGVPIIIAPRGMLQAWALRRNRLVKSVFVSLLKWLLNKEELWHATDQIEAEAIKRHFGIHQRVNIAPNIPRPLAAQAEVAWPGEGMKIRLVFLSLINRNKNLHLVLQSLEKRTSQFSLDIYGPIADEGYWDRDCREQSERLGISYKGPVPPWQVPAVLSSYHFFVLPTQGENFGHAIFDALASGVPVVISDKTPWQDVGTLGAGFEMNPDEPGSMENALTKISDLTSAEYNQMRKRSWLYATNYLTQHPFRKEYAFVFE